MANGSSLMAAKVYPNFRGPMANPGTPGKQLCDILWAALQSLMAADLLPELALIPSGEFLMGSDDADDDEKPAHRVHLDDFLIAVHPVTHAEYARFVRETGHRAPAIYELPLVVTAGGRDREKAFRSAGQPYVWMDSEVPPGSARSPGHARPVGRRDRVLRVALRRVPAGRCGCRPRRNGRRPPAAVVEGKRYPWGDRLDRNMANFLTDPSLKTTQGTTQCRTYPPNGYGLFDMTGNVWEWVHDWYSAAVLRHVAAAIADSGRAKGRCVSCAAEAGSSPTSACSPAAIATRCRLIHTRTGSVSGSSCPAE